MQGKQEKDCRGTLSVESSIVSTTITVQEADTSFVLRAILVCDKPILTKTQKGANFNETKVQVKMLMENYQ